MLLIEGLDRFNIEVRLITRFYSISFTLSLLVRLLSLHLPYIPTFVSPSSPNLYFPLSFFPLVITKEWMKVHTNGHVQYGASADIDGDFFYSKDGSISIIKILEPMNPQLNYYEYLIVKRGQDSAIGIGVHMPLNCTTSGLHRFDICGECGHCHNVGISPNLPVAHTHMYTTLSVTHTHITHHILPLTHRWVSVTIP